MSGPTTRVLTVLELLQNHSRISGAELAAHLGVDRRTIRRYISVLENLGVPVTTEQGRYGGYMLIPGFKLPPMMFTDEEVLAISMGLLAARQLGLAQAAPAIDNVQAKLERVMPENLKKRLRGIHGTTQLILPRTAELLDDSVLLILTRATQAEQSIRFCYHSPEKGVTERQVDPYGLVFRRGNWYSIGYCRLRHEMRSFRLDRISNIQTLNQFFQRPREFDAARYLTNSISNLPRNHDIAILLHTDFHTAAKAFCFLSNTASAFTEQSEGLLLNTQTDSLDWFAAWLGHLPFAFTIKGPPALKKALRQHAEALLEACR